MTVYNQFRTYALARNSKIKSIMNAPHILLIDDHTMFRNGMRLLIRESFPDMVIIEADSIETAITYEIDELSLILLDHKLKGLNGLQGLTLFYRLWPDVPVLMLSGEDNSEIVREVVSSGAAGFVSKAESSDKIIEAIRGFMPAQIAHTAADSAPSYLTPRQIEVLTLLHQGLSNKLIAQQLNITDNTVRRHVQDILEIFGVMNRSEAVYLAQKKGLLRRW